MSTGAYDESVAEAARVAEREGWITVSDTAWPGYERIPGLVMQGYTVLLREAFRLLCPRRRRMCSCRPVSVVSPRRWQGIWL